MHCALIVGHHAIYDVTKNSLTQKPCSYSVNLPFDGKPETVADLNFVWIISGLGVNE